MQLINQILASAAVVQLGLTAVTWWPSPDLAGEAHALVEVAPESISTIEIFGRKTATGEEPEALTLEKDGADWVIASADRFPADPAKVTELLEHIEDLRVRKPIATRAASHAQLDVDEDQWTRRVKLHAGDRVHDVLIGTASGQSLHARDAASDDVYAVRGTSAYAFADTASRYYDPIYVEVEPDNLRSLTVENAHGSFTLEHTEGTWTLADLPEDRVVDAEAVDRLVDALARVRIAGLAGLPTADHGLDEGVRVSWTADEGESTVTGGYAIGAESGSRRYVKGEGREHVVEVTASSLSRAVDLDLDALTEPVDAS